MRSHRSWGLQAPSALPRRSKRKQHTFGLLAGESRQSAPLDESTRGRHPPRLCEVPTLQGRRKLRFLGELGTVAPRLLGAIESLVRQTEQIP